MGNLCSTPSVRDPIGRHDRLGYGHGPMGMARPGEHPNMVNPAYGYYGVAARPTALQVPPDAMLRGPGPAQQQVSTPTTTTSTTTTTKEAENLQQAEVALPSRAPIHEGVGQEVLDDEEPYHHDQQTQFNWTKGKLIGAGAFGRVFQGLDNDSGQIMAVKQVALTKDEALKGRVAEHIKALEAEVAVLRQLNHRNIVRYLGTERSDDTLNIFLEYVPGGSIASLIDKFGPLQESVVRKYTQQILRGLEYLHQKKIMHRDIKGANILVDGTGTVKLADFGASKKIEDLATMASGSKSIRGTPFWMAPEVIKQTGHGRPADIWSLGCVVIEMATGKPPWSNCNTQVAAMFHIASTKEPPQLPEFLSAEAKDFLLLCFNRVPKERPNATRLLRHPWMANIPPNPNSASTASMAAAGNGSTGATGNGPRATQRSHPLVPMLPLQNALSPPSPIKEEPETARSQAAAAAATAAQPPVSAQRAQLPPPVPMAIGPLEHGRRQSLMPQTAASLAMSSGLPPLPPNASQRASAAVAAPSVAPPVPAAAPAPEPAAAPASAAQPPRVMTLLGQAPAEQYDTIVSPSSIPAALLAANAAAAAAAAPVPAPAAPQSNPSQELLAHATSSGAQSDSSSHSNLAELGRTSVPGVRSSMLTLNYNPMEEPSWMPAMHNQQVLPQLSRALSSIREPVDAAPSPRNAPTPRDQQQHAAPVEVVLAATTSGDSAQDTTGEADQPEGQRIVRATSAEAARKASSSAQLPAPSVTASVAGIPHASSLSKRQLAAGEADPVRQSKLQKWRDELSAELSKKRQELRTQAATGGSNGQYGLPDAALPLVSEVGEA